jgi:hypothetical protein
MAYTKYSLTPSSNTAAPPDGAPEGMLPSAVNDTMRDMMAQIRDCGDGIRDGTYTMTAPKITGGTITGSTINNSAIGGTTAAAGAFTTLSATGVTTVQAGTVSLPAITTTGDTNTGIFFPAADTIAFAEGGTESMRITSTGTVAIGTTTTPTAKLWVESGRVGLTNAYKLGWHSNPAHGDLNNYITGDDGSNYVALGTGGTERMRIDTSGNVGIGTTSPARKLQVHESTASTNAYIQLSNDATGATSTDGFQLIVGTGGETILAQRENAEMQFWTNNTERMRITSSGVAVVGATSAFNGNVLFSVQGSGGMEAKATGGTNFSPYLAWNNATSGDNIFHIFYTETSITQRGSIDYNRGAGLVRYNTSSDATLKNIIGDSDRQKSIEILNTTRIREFAWKDDAEQKPQIGVIAQELYETYKGAVSVGGEQEDGKYRPWGVDKTAFTFHLIAGWQEHEKMIKELNAKVDAQALEIATLKGK